MIDALFSCKRADVVGSSLDYHENFPEFRLDLSDGSIFRLVCPLSCLAYSSFLISRI